MDATSRIPHGRIIVGLILATLVGLALMSHVRSRVAIEFTLQAQSTGWLQVFHDRAGRWSERRSRWWPVGPSTTARRLEVGGKDARFLRVDPPNGDVTRLCGLSVAGVAGQFEILGGDRVELQRSQDCLVVTTSPQAVDPLFSLRFTGASLDTIDRAGHWRGIRDWALLLIGVFLSTFAVVHRKSWSRAIESMPTWPGFFVLERRIVLVCVPLMLAFGIAFIAITPPGAVPDEAAHLAKIVKIGEGVPFGNADGRPMPSTHAMYGPFSDYLINKTPFTYGQLQQQANQPLACEPETVALPRGADGYFPHQHLLPAGLFKASCMTGASFGTFLYLSRLLNLLLATALVAWGLSKAVRGKWALLLVALLPMSLFQMASISADSLTIAASLAWLGLVSGIAGGKVTPGKAAPALWTLALVIALLKPGAAWVLACLLFCKPAYDRAGKSFARALALHVALPWAIHVAWALSASDNAPVLKGVDPAANLALLASEPVTFLRMLVSTYTGERGLLQLERMIGVLGWLDVRLSGWAYAAGMSALLAAFWANGVSREPWRVLGLAWAAVLGSLVLVALPLFFLWTPLGHPAIEGLQGRYFIPAAAFALTWSSLRSPAGIRVLLVAWMLLVVVAINVDALRQMYLAYFVVGRP
ncbi:DUF2142 domain-containing protein [Marilutibacter alkalisoli]|uniref:DUF2142 domain-containing protein n=1 Tax=Marilutibacter alkalisoli TaxID=2591633 RepID=A0A514BUD9_9GAMM|nr:DUF2142 domain-containing protein [Lysobacter alkalisoli]QDH71024.1 DUF2142 domain-containing protein [Lysobacter alkalisoli]